MAHRQAKSKINKDRQQPQVLKYQGKQSRGIQRQAALRKSARLQAIEKPHNQLASEIDHTCKVQAPPSPPISNVPINKKALQHPHPLHGSPEPSRKGKRKREQDAGTHSPQTQDQPPSKRLQTLPSSCNFDEGAASDTSGRNIDPVKYWTQNRRWPKEFFEQDSQVRQDLEQDSWLEEQMEYSNPVVDYVEINGFRYPRPIKKVPTSLRRKQSDSSLTSSSDQKKRENKSAPYRDKRYAILLEAKGSFMGISDLGITAASNRLYRSLLQSKQAAPKDSLFRGDMFEKTCRKIQDSNEGRVIQDIARLIVPSAETLATYGAMHLDQLLIESVNESWMGSIPVEGPKPQPDYAVGFKRSAFTDEQLRKIGPLIGSVWETSFFVATYRMDFPFLTCEVKCGAAALDIADRQNAHSMTVAVRSVVELYRAVHREEELHREILAFSISHDHRSVRIYGHYPVIEGDNTTFYRHPIREFFFTASEGRQKWASYRFTKNVYDIWVPIHYLRICSAIDDLPSDIDFGLSQSASFPQSGCESP
ncbi:MAG: hypothetical protein Q9225_006900 [Loekoesia sp. 1 TL-2023]